MVPVNARLSALVVAGVILQGCMLTPPTDLFVSYDHLSHPKQGPPFGSRLEEGTLDSVGVTGRWDLNRRTFVEMGLSYALPDSDLYGDDLLFNGRVAYKLWSKHER